jgi:mannonate dehydratase
MPVYDVLGGKCREAANNYQHVSGRDIPELIDNARKVMAQGTRNILVNIGDGGGTRTRRAKPADPAVLHDYPNFDRDAFLRQAVNALEACRTQLGEEVGLSIDIHERVLPRQAVQLAKDVEKLKLFFLEDPLSLEDIDYFREIRQQSSTPIAMGELFTSPQEWMPVITGRLIDYLRIHVPQAGGLTPCRKVAILAEPFGVRTAWHGPGDLSPVGHCANLALDLSLTNFGIQEGGAFSPAVQEVFKGCPVHKNGYMYANEAPGWGMEIDEAAAAKYPFDRSDPLDGGWADLRTPDGAVIKQ